MRTLFRRAVLAPLGGLVFLVAPLPAAVVADLSVRYVNNEVITWGDVMLRNQLRQEVQRGRALAPHTMAELLTFSRDSLEELTDESLLYQKAAELKILVDHDDIVLEVLDNAKRAGQGLTLREQALQRRQLERTRTAERLISFFDAMAPQVTPDQLRQRYDAGGSHWDRLARVHALQIVLRPTTADERAQLKTAKSALLRRAQDARTPELAGRIQARLDAFLAAAARDQEGVLDGLVDDIAATPEGFDAADQGLVMEARSLLARRANVMDSAEAGRRLDAIRFSFTGLTGDALAKAFKTAGAISQAPVDPGWTEPGTYTPEWDRVATTAPLGDVAAPFASQGVVILLLPLEREPARRRTFDEVSSELERTYRWERRDAVKKQQVAIQRARASIRDLADLADLLKP